MIKREMSVLRLLVEKTSAVAGREAEAEAEADFSAGRDYDDDTRSVTTIVPHELESVEEEDEKQMRRSSCCCWRMRRNRGGGASTLGMTHPHISQPTTPTLRSQPMSTTMTATARSTSVHDQALQPQGGSHRSSISCSRD